VASWTQGVMASVTVRQNPQWEKMAAVHFTTLNAWRTWIIKVGIN